MLGRGGNGARPGKLRGGRGARGGTAGHRWKRCRIRQMLRSHDAFSAPLLVRIHI